MADIYRDFAYCKVTGYLDPATTSVPVDETDRLPSNAELAAGDFWMTFESSYAQDEFEIVKLVSKSVEVGAGTLVVQRAQHGSTAYARSPGVMLKHALTAEMLRRLVAAGGYKRYVDLGNPPTVAGVSSAYAGSAVLRGVAAGQAGGATVVAGVLVARGMEGAAAGSSTASATELTLTQDETSMFGTQMYGS